MVSRGGAEPGDVLERARQGDGQAFAILIEPIRVGLFRHCYRMLGSGPDAEDALQDSLLRAYRGLATYDGSGELAAWLYRIATNVCLDHLRNRRRRTHPVLFGPPAHLTDQLGTAADADPAWVEPVSDGELGIGIDPQDAIASRETVSLAFVASLHQLPPRQRAALLLHDVLGFSPTEVAEVLAASPSAVNSLLHRAREAASSTQPDPRPGVDDPRVIDLADRYSRAWDRADIDAFVDLVTEDITFSMPPMPQWFSGRHDVVAFVEGVIFAPSRPYGVTVRLGRCNAQLAVAVYEPDGSGALRVSGLQVLELEDRAQPLISGITSYRIPELAVRCGFPSLIEAPSG